MNRESAKPHDASRGRQKTVLLYPGIALSFLDGGPAPFPPACADGADVLQISCCRTGQMIWNTQNGGRICLNPGDFSLHAIHRHAGSPSCFPTGQYQGLAISIDLQKTAEQPPELLKGTDIFPHGLRERFRRSRTMAFFPANEQTEAIFAGFYSQPEKLALPYQRIKVLELLLYLAQGDDSSQDGLPEYPPEQIRIVREIHDHLIRNMDRRITIEELSRQYLVNPTTLKAAFKAVYGTSLAAHVKKHRMEQAAKMLREMDWSIAEIAQAVGYDSQSKFSAAFKEVFDILPSMYRKQNCG